MLSEGDLWRDECQVWESILTWSELLILLARRTWVRWEGAKPKACASPSSVEQRSQRVQGRVRVGSTGVITSVVIAERQIGSLGAWMEAAGPSCLMAIPNACGQLEDQSEADGVIKVQCYHWGSLEAWGLLSRVGCSRCCVRMSHVGALHSGSRQDSMSACFYGLVTHAIWAVADGTDETEIAVQSDGRSKTALTDDDLCRFASQSW